MSGYARHFNPDHAFGHYLFAAVSAGAVLYCVMLEACAAAASNEKEFSDLDREPRIFERASDFLGRSHGVTSRKA
jgi:hypothetical protein